jgi:hypothetical protein
LLLGCKTIVINFPSSFGSLSMLATAVKLHHFLHFFQTQIGMRQFTSSKSHRDFYVVTLA